MFHRLLVPLFLVAALLAGPALAQRTQESREQQLKQLLQRFPEADANRDGTLTVEEAQAYRAQTRGKEESQRERKPPAPSVTPTHADVHYGPHERQVLDFYQAKSSQPTPVIIYIHGGGFVGGDKRSVNPAMLQDALDAGISFAAIHYRFVDGDATIFPAPQHDGARAVQFIRSQTGSGISIPHASPVTAAWPGQFTHHSAFRQAIQGKDRRRLRRWIAS